MSACAVHSVRPVNVFRTVIIARGITIPVPPPSLIAQPVQNTSVWGDVEFELEAESEGTMVAIYLHEHVTNQSLSAEVIAPADSFAFDLEMDHSANCLELWLETADGESSTPVRIHTDIAEDDQGVEVVDGCDDSVEPQAAD